MIGFGSVDSITELTSSSINDTSVTGSGWFCISILKQNNHLVDLTSNRKTWVIYLRGSSDPLALPFLGRLCLPFPSLSSSFILKLSSLYSLILSALDEIHSSHLDNKIKFSMPADGQIRSQPFSSSSSLDAYFPYLLRFPSNVMDFIQLVPFGSNLCWDAFGIVVKPLMKA